MRIAAESYATGSSSCSTVLTKKEWESGLRLSGKAAQFYTEAQKNFFLIASGLCATWQQQADKSLAAQREYVNDDIESPLLSEALEEISAGFLEMGQSDEERAFALKTSYIAQNPNPAGSRDLYEFAPGPQTYHAAHKKTPHNLPRDP
jgi:hypothetical protein